MLPTVPSKPEIGLIVPRILFTYVLPELLPVGVDVDES